MTWEVAGEMGLVHGDILEADYSHVLQFQDPVNEKKWVTMRKDLFDRFDIQNGHAMPDIITTMDGFLSWAQSKQADYRTFLSQLVECESPSGDAAAIGRFVDLMASHLDGIAEVRRVPAGEFGVHAQFVFPGLDDGQVLALGHSDTVYPLGTLAEMPFHESEGRLWGPGVLDMKGGVALLVFAMRALRELDVCVSRTVLLQLVADEEVGSESSRQLTEDEARRSCAVLVLEPGTGLQGKAKTARKGVGDYTVRVRGRAAHAGVDFQAGASAVLELARQIERIASFTDLSRGVTVNPGVIGGGTRGNVIAAEAWVEVDIRVERLADAAELDRLFHTLRAEDPRCSLEVSGGLNRPPMERTQAGAALFQRAAELAAELGVVLDESSTGGGSDGNFTASLAPTLDGIGAVGEGAHSPGESILADRIPDRMALLAKLIAAL